MYKKHNFTAVVCLTNGIYNFRIPDELYKELTTGYLRVTLQKDEKLVTFLSKLNRRITVIKNLAKELTLNHRDELKVDIVELDKRIRPKQFFRNGKIDLLSLIPEKTTTEKDVVVDEFLRSGERWLRVKYFLTRSYAREIEIMRFVDIRPFGEMLGQMQAEGTKFLEKYKVTNLEFTNKILEEHMNFVCALRQLGLSNDIFYARLNYNPARCTKTEIMKISREYIKRTCIKNCKIFQSGYPKLIYSIKTFVRRSILFEIIFNSMNEMRKAAAKSLTDKNMQIFVEAFAQKLLTGDGSLDVTATKSKYPSLRLVIIDENLEYRNDYEKIFRNLGFHVSRNETKFWVKLGVSLKNFLFLYKIKAFKSSNNWNKMLIAIALILEGRRYSTYKRFLRLKVIEHFDVSDVSSLCNTTDKLAKNWIYNKEKEGLIKKAVFDGVWSMTEKGKEVAELLDSWQKDFQNLTYAKKTTDLAELLKSTKIKRREATFQPNRAPTLEPI